MRASLDIHASGITDDEVAIAEVIHRETQAFMDADFELWASCFVKDDRVIDVGVDSRTGVNVVRGWTDFSANVQRILREGLGCGIVEYRKDNMQISVDQDTAWAVYDGWAKNEDGNTWESFTTCVLEREHDGWKIVYHGFADVRNAKAHMNEISVDKDGRLIWASKGSLEKIKQHSILALSAGRIRAQRRDWDRALQKAIFHAGRYHGYFELRRFTEDSGGALEYPAVLGDTDDGGVAVVHVSVRDNVTYLQFDVAESLDRRLAVAQAVFGISEGQLRVAHQIAQGFGLKSVAATLDISINTARTHLARLYEKTGVSSQTALVRLLLSVG